MKICVYGLWHLGSVTAACMASVGHEVIGFDDMLMANWESYKLSTIKQPIRQMSKLVTQLIDQYIQDPDFEPANHSIEGKFIKRKTTK